MTPALLTPELFWLTLTVILTGLLWVPYILNRVQVRGLGGSMANPSRHDKPHAAWATRLMFAHDNAIENLVIFAPLVLILAQIDYSTKWTVWACAVYFWARVAHLIVYTLGLPVFRTLAFSVGFLAQVVLALAIFRVFWQPRGQGAFCTTTNSIAACLLSKPLPSPCSSENELQLP